MECEKANEKKARELKFSRVDDAIEWIREHKTEVALGTVVIIAGVAFVITTGGAGALILAPLAL
jgi:peptide subunit release factor 1 (eRF1)